MADSKNRRKYYLVGQCLLPAFTLSLNIRILPCQLAMVKLSSLVEELSPLFDPHSLHDLPLKHSPLTVDNFEPAKSNGTQSPPCPHLPNASLPARAEACCSTPHRDLSHMSSTVLVWPPPGCSWKLYIWCILNFIPFWNSSSLLEFQGHWTLENML